MIDDCLKVTSYFGERQHHHGRLLSDALLDTFEEYDLATSILLRATGGFGLRHHLRTDQTLTMSEDPSLMAIAADNRTRVEAALPRLLKLQDRGMVTVERARLIRDDRPTPEFPEQLHEATKLTIYVGRHDRTGRQPAHVALCDVLHRRGIAGASVIVGVDGTSHGRRERASFFSANRGVPTMVLAVGDGHRIRQVLPELHTIVDRPMITVERVRICKRDGHLLARPHQLPATASNGLGLWQKLTIYTSEHHRSGGEPIHRGIIRQLRATRARGVTSLRGIWGFHGDHAPHGDRLLQLGRRVPMVTVVVDTPAGIAQSFDVVDALTTEHGLVTSEMVPAMQYLTPLGDRGGLALADHDY